MQPLVLEVGCGLGSSYKSLRDELPSGHRFVGLDSSLALLASAEWNTIPNSAAVRLVTGDAGSLPFSSATFDAVFCHGLLMHLPSPVTALHEMKRVLRPRGRLLCIEPDKFSKVLDRLDWDGTDGGLEEIKTAIETMLRAEDSRRKLGLGDTRIGRKLQQMLSQVGLRVSLSRLVDMTETAHGPGAGPYQQAFQGAADAAHAFAGGDSPLVHTPVHARTDLWNVVVGYKPK